MPPEPETPGLFEQIKATRDAAKQLVKSHVELAKAEFADITDAIKRAAILVGVAIYLVVRHWALRRQAAPATAPAPAELAGAAFKS